MSADTGTVRCARLCGCVRRTVSPALFFAFAPVFPGGRSMVPKVLFDGGGGDVSGPSSSDGRQFVAFCVYVCVRHTVLPTLCAVFAIVFGREQKLRTQKVRTLARCGPFVPCGSTEDYFAVRLWLPPRRAYRLPCHSKTPETFSGSEMSACSSPRLPTW